MSDDTTNKTFRWVAGWLIMLVLLAAVSRTRTGHVLIYYSLATMLILVLLTQANYIAEFLGAVGDPVPR